MRVLVLSMAGAIIVGAFLPVGFAGTGSPVAESSKVDSLFAAVAHGSGPGAAVVVIRDGKVVHKKGYGLANLEQGTPCTPETKFRIVSLTKAFTTMAILILHEREVLPIDDAIGKHLPDCPKGDTITIRQLLTHTAGVQEPVPDAKAFDPLPVMNTPLEKRYAMCRDEPLEFNPGERWSYTKAGYIVLGYLAEIYLSEGMAPRDPPTS